MADTNGQNDIRTLFIDTLIKGFAEENPEVFYNNVNVQPTDAREIRWVQKTSGFLTSPTTSGMTTDLIETAEGAKPVVLSQSWTRNTSYVKMWKAETETISEEDIKDNMVDVISAHLRDVTRAVQKKRADHIWDILTESRSVTNINSVTTTSVGGDQWDAASGLNPVKDIERAKTLIRENNYEPTHLFVSPRDYEALKVFVYNNGAQAPQMGMQVLEGKNITSFLELQVVVSNSVTADYACVANPKKAVTYREFMGLSSARITDPLIGEKIRVATEGIAILTDPKAVTLIIDTRT